MAAAAVVVVAVVVADVAGNSAFHTRQLSPGEFTLSGALVFPGGLEVPPCLGASVSLCAKLFSRREGELRTRRHGDSEALSRLPTAPGLPTLTPLVPRG